MKQCPRVFLLVAGLAGCNGTDADDGGLADGGPTDGGRNDARRADARSGDAAPPDAARADAARDLGPQRDTSVPTDQGPAPDAGPPPACAEALAQRCYTPSGSLGGGQQSGVVVRSVRWGAGARVLLQHRGVEATDAVGWSLCAGRTCAALPTLRLESGQWTVVHTDINGADQADEVFLGAGTLPLGPEGEIALYRAATDAERTPAALERFVAWGSARVPAQSQIANAVAASRWPGLADFVSVCGGAAGLVVVGASDRPQGYRAQPDTPAACGDGFQ